MDVIIVLGVWRVSNFLEGKSLVYNLFQDAFISVFCGGVMFLVKYLVARGRLVQPV
jgi:hypothetical protein